MTKSHFSSNGTSNKCPFCNTVPAVADRHGIQLIRLAKPTDKLVFHISCHISGAGLKITAEQNRQFNTISSGRTLEALYLSDKVFKKFIGYFHSLSTAGNDKQKFYRSKVILDGILYQDAHRISEEEIQKATQVQIINESENYQQNGSSLQIAALAS
jgi:hypothetical protein